MSEAFVQTPRDIEHKSPITDWFAEVGKLISNHLQAVAIFGDVQITLDDVTELSIEGHGLGLSVTKEFPFETEPNEASSRRIEDTIGHNFMKLRRDGAI